MREFYQRHIHPNGAGVIVILNLSQPQTNMRLGTFEAGEISEPVCFETPPTCGSNEISRAGLQASKVLLVFSYLQMVRRGFLPKSMRC